MLGRASYMRLPDIVGVKLTGKRQPGITATDIVLALTEFLRKERVVSTYLEFFGEGAAALTLGDRATISNMTPEFGATAAMFYIDQQTLEITTPQALLATHDVEVYRLSDDPQSKPDWQTLGREILARLGEGKFQPQGAGAVAYDEASGALVVSLPQPDQAIVARLIQTP